jgi:5-methylcytosine-specific restriction enzyme subunit McrC
MHIYEYTRLAIGSEGGSQTLSEEQVTILKKLNGELKRRKIIAKNLYQWVDRDHIKFLNYAGVITICSEQIEIFPKIFAEKDGNTTGYEESFTAFARMVSYIFRSTIFDKDLINMRESEKIGVLDMVIFFYMSNLKAALNNGIYSQYEQEIFDSRYIRGKICFNQQLNRMPGSAYIQESHLFTCNNELMKYLKACTLYFANLSKSNWLRIQMHRLSSLFGDVDTIDINKMKNKNIKFNRLNEPYQDAYNLSRLILSGLLIKPNSSESVSGVVFLLDMNKLFEDFFAAFIENNWKKLSRKHSSAKILKQKSSKYLFIDRKARPLIPDVRVLNPSDETEIVFDTKYKSKPEPIILGDAFSRVSKVDLYQMYAYSTKYNAKETILVYPSLHATSELDSLSFEKAQRLRIWEINLNLFDEEWEGKMIRELAELIQSVNDS